MSLKNKKILRCINLLVLLFLFFLTLVLWDLYIQLEIKGNNVVLYIAVFLFIMILIFFSLIIYYILFSKNDIIFMKKRNENYVSKIQTRKEKEKS